MKHHVETVQSSLPTIMFKRMNNKTVTLYAQHLGELSDLKCIQSFYLGPCGLKISFTAPYGLSYKT